MTGRIAFINARLLDPATGLDAAGGLLVEYGAIVEAGEGLFSKGAPKGAEVIDCGGHCLAPGLVDMWASLGEPGAAHPDALAASSRAAAAGGITTLVCTPNTTPVTDDSALVHYIRHRARDASVVNVHPMAAITKGLKGQEMTEMGLLGEAGAVAFTDADRAVGDPVVMRRALEYAHAFGALIVQHAEDPALAAEGCMTEGEVATRLGLTGIPEAAEVIMVERDLRLVELTGGRYHVAQISTAAAIEAVRGARARDLPVTAAAAPHHFALNDTAVGEYRTFAKTSPPLRGEDDRKAVVAGLADGTVSVIVSAHVPLGVEAKRQTFEQAAPGIAGLETMLPLALELYHGGHVTLLDVLAAMSANPAELLGLPGGTLATGTAADLVLFDLEAPWRIDTGKFVAGNSPYDGRPVQGRVLRTVVGGNTVFEATP